MTEILSYSPPGPARPNMVYVSWKLNKAMSLAAKRKDCTKDDLLEQVMTRFLESEHKDIMDWLAKREDEEKQFVKGLKPDGNKA